MSWSSGIAGIGWTLEFLTGEYDLIGGLVGFAVYALGRLSRPSGQEILERVVAELARSARADGTRRSWLTPPEQLPPWQQKVAAHGCFNAGLAHGVPGVMAVLARCVEAGISIELARPLLDGAVEWLLAQRLDRSDARFPAWLPVGAEPSGPSRAAWCYGDPGVACALMCAARAVDEPAWAREASELILGVSRSPMTDCGIVDAGLCHGAFGLALTLARFFQLTGHGEIESSAREWGAPGSRCARRARLPASRATTVRRQYGSQSRAC